MHYFQAALYKIYTKSIKKGGGGYTMIIYSSKQHTSARVATHLSATFLSD